MFNSVADFLKMWEGESEKTQRMFDALTDKSLSQAVASDHRTLGRVAWHIVTTIPEMMALTGLKLEIMVDPGTPVPSVAKEIAQAYRALSGALAEEIGRTWNDQTLAIEDETYGERWSRRFTLTVLINHQIHHRGQMTVLMRQAGLRVPGIYGPAMEDWAQYGAPVPEV